MNELERAIENLRVMAAKTVIAAENAYTLATSQPMPPEGRSLGDKAIIVFLAERMAEARKLLAELSTL